MPPWRTCENGHKVFELRTETCPDCKTYVPLPKDADGTGMKPRLTQKKHYRSWRKDKGMV